MNQKKYNIKSILLTVFLLLAALLIAYSCIGVLISGPAQKYRDEQEDMQKQIADKTKGSETVYRHSFQYVTYVCETKNSYVIYDKNAKKIATRKKSELRLDKVKEKIMEIDSSLVDAKIIIGYGYDNPAYVIEQGNTWLYLDFDSLDTVFYMKEGS